MLGHTHHRRLLAATATTVVLAATAPAAAAAPIYDVGSRPSPSASKSSACRSTKA